MPLVLGLHGAKGSGKDEFFKIVDHHFPNLNVRKVAYADPIKHEVCRIFNLVNEEEYDLFKRTHIQWTLKSGQAMPNQVHGRQVVREIGMMMRLYDENQFVRYVESQIKSDPSALWCITDLRFNNEYASIKSIGGSVVKIVRPGFGYDGHITETEFADSKCSVVINNDKTLQDYETCVVDTINSLLQTLSVN